jgi:thiamine kinase-like enzyme
MVIDAIKELIQEIPILRRHPVAIRPLAGGMTNRIYKIDAGDVSYVVRLFGPGTELLGIDRAREVACARAAASAGVGPEVVAFLPEHSALVTRFIPGHPLDGADLARPTVLPRIADTLRRCHAMPMNASMGRFSVFETVRNYVALARARRVDLPPSLDAALEFLEHIEKELASAAPACLCHNDLLASNLIDDGTTFRFIDWEYAGGGDRFFDLGNFAVHFQLTDEQEQVFLQAYFGTVRPELLRRLKLMRIASDLREASWGFLQQAIAAVEPPPEYGSFLNYGKKHLERMMAAAARHFV